MSKFQDFDKKFNSYTQAIKDGDVETAYAILTENKSVLEAVANNSENTVHHFFELGYLGPSAEKIYNLLVENVHETKKDRIFEKGVRSWSFFLEYAKLHPKSNVDEKKADPEIENRTWFLKTVLIDILRSENPNKVSLFSLYPDLDGEIELDEFEVSEFYEAAMMYAREHDIAPIDIITPMVKYTDYLYYFLSGEEYEKLFKYFFDRLTDEDKNTLKVLINAKEVKSLDDLNNLAYLANCISDNPVENPGVSESLAEEIKSLAEAIQTKNDDLINEEYGLRESLSGKIDYSIEDDDLIDAQEEALEKQINEMTEKTRTELKEMRQLYKGKMQSAIFGVLIKDSTN